MSTAYKAQRASSSAHMQAFGNAVIFDDYASVTAALAVGDTVDLVKVAGGTRAAIIRVKNDDCDTGATLQVKIGYRPADPGGVLVAKDDAFGTALTFLQAAGTTDLNIDPIDFNEDVIVFATVTAAAAGQAAGAKKVAATVIGTARGVK